MSKVVDGWIIMWGFAYVSCAFIKPDLSIGVPRVLNAFFLSLIGCLILVGFVFSNNSKGKKLLFAMGVIETVAGVLSWISLLNWNVPFQSEKVIFFNISMAVLDFIGAGALFTKSLEK
jgi:hypothetical protein